MRNTEKYNHSMVVFTFFSFAGHTVETGTVSSDFEVERSQQSRENACFLHVPNQGVQLFHPISGQETQEATWQLQFFSTGCCCCVVGRRPNFRLAHHDENGSCHLHCMLNYLPISNFYALTAHLYLMEQFLSIW